MRLRGLEKKRATINAREMRAIRTRRLTKVDADWKWLQKVPPNEMVGGKAAEYWQVMAYHAGWLRRKPSPNPMYLMKFLWPQEDIYEAIYSASPFLGMIRKEAGE